MVESQNDFIKSVESNMSPRFGHTITKSKFNYNLNH